MNFQKPIKILVTPKEACEIWEEVTSELIQEVEPVLAWGEIQDPSKLATLLGEVDAAILALERVTDEILKKAERLRVISRFGVGHETVDTTALKAKGIRLTITPGAATAGVARQAIAFLLASNYNLKGHFLNFARGKWERFSNRSCSETTLGVVGVGRIGSEVARLAVGLGFRVIGYDIVDFSVNHVERVFSLKELVEKSDVISLHVPSTEKTQKMISGETLSSFKGKGLINNARGSIVDEEAILKSLERGDLSFYAADVFQNEPVTGLTLKLAQHDRVLGTPHVGAMDHASAVQCLKQAFANVLHCLKGNDERVQSYVV